MKSLGKGVRSPCSTKKNSGPGDLGARGEFRAAFILYHHIGGPVWAMESKDGDQEHLKWCQMAQSDPTWEGLGTTLGRQMHNCMQATGIRLIHHGNF